MSKVMRAIGLMSGTSMDGIDIALVETDGEAHVRRLASSSEAYPDAFRADLRQAMADAQAMTSRAQRPGCLAEVERDLTERHAAAVTRFMGDRLLQPAAVDVIGFHGQTVLHRETTRQTVRVTPPRAILDAPQVGSVPVNDVLTVQLGDGPLLARRTGVDVVHDLRANDCALGGEGAPLVPIYHGALAAKVTQRPLAFVNIGGVANITWVGPGGRLIAFDTGPGNALIDDWMLRHTGTARDESGRVAATGSVNEGILRQFLCHPYFTRVAPKSLDRNAFPAELVAGLSPADGAATLTAFTAEAIARARELVPEQPQMWVVAGGGRRNQTLMSMIAARVENVVVPAEALDLDGDTMEAEAWAYLAVRSLKGLPLTFPETTGVNAPTTGGRLARAPC